jgi:hypothetical protein
MNAFARTTAFSDWNENVPMSSTVIPFKRPEKRNFITDEVNKWSVITGQKLEDLVNLPLGWDGYNGRGVKIQNAFFAINLLASICPPNFPPPAIVPGSDGSLQLEWHDFEFDIEIDISAPYKATAWRLDHKMDNSISEQTIELTNDFKAVSIWINDFITRRSHANTASA